MAITRTIRPVVIARGTVVRLAERRTREDNRLFAHAVTLQQDSGAQLAIDMFIPREGPAPKLPELFQPWAVVAEVAEGQYGASLNFASVLSDEQLEELSRSILQPVGK